MERVATLMHSTAMLGELMRTQRNLLDAQTQVSTGKRINEFADSPSDLGALLAARAADSKAADFEASAKAILGRLDLQNTHMEEMANVVADLKQAVMDSIANGGAGALMSEVEGTVGRMVSILNTQVDGKYIYGGTRQDVPPVSVDSLNALLGLPATADAFENNAVAQTAQIDANQSVAFGQLASALGEPLFDLVRQIGAFHAGASGPFSGDLTTAQADFLTALVPDLTDAYTQANTALASNGVSYRAAADAIERHGEARATLKGMISDIEDVDMAEAITKLNDAQTALQASAKSFAVVQGLSLLDYLPL
jgi:flagellar hook-associated protein 3 FlgL